MPPRGASPPPAACAARGARARARRARSARRRATSDRASRGRAWRAGRSARTSGRRPSVRRGRSGSCAPRWHMRPIEPAVCLPDEIFFRVMAQRLDETDVLLLDELQRDADRPNVELARLAGLSPAATLNRVRRLKQSGVIEGIHANVDETAAGFGLCVYVSVTLGRHEEALERRFETTVAELPQITSAAWVAGETDALLTVVARDLAELQRVLVALSTRGGAQRVVTLLRLRQLKHDSPLPLGESRRLR